MHEVGWVGGVGALDRFKCFDQSCVFLQIWTNLVFLQVWTHLFSFFSTSNLNKKDFINSPHHLPCFLFPLPFEAWRWSHATLTVMLHGYSLRVRRQRIILVERWWTCLCCITHSTHGTDGKQQTCFCCITHAGNCLSRTAQCKYNTQGKRLQGSQTGKYNMCGSESGSHAVGVFAASTLSRRCILGSVRFGEPKEWVRVALPHI